MYGYEKISNGAKNQTENGMQQRSILEIKNVLYKYRKNETNYNNIYQTTTLYLGEIKLCISDMPKKKTKGYSNLHFCLGNVPQLKSCY